ncbi:MAG: tRNA (guanosine(37)-N1)-methyltransferase TrmD [Desulfobacula sp.]|jgi:tRNA (guanine37-N1)-methyltransferase|uniref:tRNA (guanosine(37)-N1)-methyltransferase TrmD n=1 Tax=Desulfobacula sp. TaxID=2593537 RepID=UPI001E0CF294|nr:tRNA (guanosine(37)-N1)-methyltransferase TrmD [Desulfobacula sp.]MBT3485224.1 tRNA (guanosine(37)-N1)-methyltransferase TrmD [Desulfobacula sp.]MBT3804770.1 tRNA (guanosine(37)-N1)-methyltransferase TrmD [Desulfobacula sp.]MBT4025247.1 tRNA (guanosine(37)-N1)-methyltransferase TrmD [Desulfobacula sp.]MBT4200119.1 tRNA (guanosine(37)-N1)-methyltransferase TrmD [Desulfobacula sp.]
MDFSVLTLFPEFISSFFEHGMISRGIEKGLIRGHCINIRDFSTDRHNTVDDRPYGGGSGMIMKPESLMAAILQAKKNDPGSKVVLMSPQGTRFNQEKAFELSCKNEGLIFVCGRYEGIDERIYTSLVDEEISIGDYVMTGGELASMVIIDSVARLIPGVLGSCESCRSDSFTDDRLEYAQYTRPEEFEGLNVPEVLLSGDHEKISLWRKKSSLQRTFLKRPDLFKKNKPNAEEKAILRQWSQELESLARE